MSPFPIKLGIADDHALVREALIIALSNFPKYEFVLKAGDGEELMKNLQAATPDVVLIDVNMPRVNGIQALEHLREHHPSVRVLILSAFLDETYVMQSLKYGVNGYLTKNLEIEELTAAIDLAFLNKVYFNNLMANAFLRVYVTQHLKNMEACLPEFSAEEIRMLDLLKAEKTTAEISHIMHISQRSVEIKRDKMRKKANAKTLQGLLMYAVKRGLIPLEDGANAH